MPMSEGPSPAVRSTLGRPAATQPSAATLARCSRSKDPIITRARELQIAGVGREIKRGISIAQSAIGPGELASQCRRLVGAFSPRFGRSQGRASAWSLPDLRTNWARNRDEALHLFHARESRSDVGRSRRMNVLDVARRMNCRDVYRGPAQPPRSNEAVVILCPYRVAQRSWQSHLHLRATSEVVARD